MERTRAFLGIGILLVTVVALGVAACAPAPEPTAAPPQATTAPPTATTAPVQPVATTAVAAPTVAVVEEVKVRVLPVLTKPGPNPLAKRGGVYRVTQPSPSDWQVWESAVSFTLWPSTTVYGTLLTWNVFAQGKGTELMPNVIYDWWTNATGEKWTMKLLQGVKFHDGVELTCKDVEFMIETIRDGRDATGKELRRSPRADLIRRVKDVRCPDDYTVEVLTDGPLPSLLTVLTSGNFAPLPRHIFEGHTDLALDQLGPGIGAFKFESHIPTEITRLKRNPNYFEQPYPYLDEVQYIWIDATTAARAAFRVGRLEAGASLTRAQREEMAKAGKVIIGPRRSTHGTTTIHTNWKRAPWNDKRFARAVRCAVDSRKAMDVTESLGFEGGVFPLPTEPDAPKYSLTLEEWMAVDPCQSPSGSKENMAKRHEIARGLMKELGFSPENPARPLIPLQQGAADGYWPATLEDLKAVGIDPIATLVTYAQSVEKASAGDFDIYSHGFVTLRFDADHWLYEHYYSTSNRNYGKYTNAETDALIDQQSRTLDPVERKKLINQIERILLKDNAKIHVIHSGTVDVIPAYVKDFYNIEPSNQQNTFQFVRVWIDEAIRKQIWG